MDPLTLTLCLACFFAVCFFIAHYGKSRTGRSTEEYFIAGRRIGGFVAALTYSATTYSAFMMVGLVGLTAIHGVGALGFELIYLMGLVLAVAFGLRFYAAGRVWGFITPAQLLSYRFQSPFLGVVVAVLYHVFLIPYMAVQLIGAGSLLSGVTGGAIPFEAGAIALAAVAFAYTLWGGMRAVAWTDALQSLVMLASSIAMLIVVFQLAGGFTQVFAKLSSEPEVLSVPGPHGKFVIPVFISMTVPWFFFSISNPQVVQRFYIPRSVRSLRDMLRGFLVFGFTYTIIVTLLGLAAHVLVPHIDNQNMVTPALLTMVPEPIAVLVIIGILAASISTLDSIMLTLSSAFALDVVKALRPTCSDSLALKLGKAFMVVIILATVAFSFTRGLIVELAVTSSMWLLQLVPAFIAALVWSRAGRLSAASSIGVGVAVTAILSLLGVNPLKVSPGVWGFIASSITLISVALMESPSRVGASFKQGLEEFIKSSLTA